MQYRTIRAAASAEFVEKRSRFIGYISPVTTQQDAIAFIDSIKSKHWDATHNVPAYIIRNGNESSATTTGLHFIHILMASTIS